MKKAALVLVSLMAASMIAAAGGCAVRQSQARPPASVAAEKPDPPAASGSSAAPQASGQPTSAAPPVSTVYSDGQPGSDAILASPSPTPTPASLVGRAVRGASAVAEKTALSPFKFLWKSVKENYSGDGDTATPGTAQALAGKNGSAATNHTHANPSATPKPLKDKVESAVSTATDATERTVFLPLKLLDDGIGLLFSPF